MDNCSHCGGELPANATFCPACGRRTDAPRPDPAVLPVAVESSEPRVYGLGSPPFVLAAAVGLLVLGIVLIVFDLVAGGVIAIVLGACLLPSFFAAARHSPDAPLARVSLSTADRARGEAGAAVESVSTWSKAGRDLVRHRRQQHQLRRERDATIQELGVSAYADDGRADELRAAAKELDATIEANEERMQRTLDNARKRVRRERAAVVSTEVIPPDPPGEVDETTKS